jgi:hypothetical protein
MERWEDQNVTMARKSQMERCTVEARMLQLKSGRIEGYKWKGVEARKLQMKCVENIR